MFFLKILFVYFRLKSELYCCGEAISLLFSGSHFWETLSVAQQPQTICCDLFTLVTWKYTLEESHIDVTYVSSIIGDLKIHSVEKLFSHFWEILSVTQQPQMSCSDLFIQKKIFPPSLNNSLIRIQSEKVQFQNQILICKIYRWGNRKTSLKPH